MHCVFRELLALIIFAHTLHSFASFQGSYLVENLQKQNDNDKRKNQKIKYKGLLLWLTLRTKTTTNLANSSCICYTNLFQIWISKVWFHASGSVFLKTWSQMYTNCERCFIFPVNLLPTGGENPTPNIDMSLCLLEKLKETLLLCSFVFWHQHVKMF